MRFIHTGDIHLGAMPESRKEWAKNRGDEIWQTFERLIKKIKAQPVDMLIIAGDLFHRQPLLRELKEVDYLFSTIPETKVVLCAGNHDAIKKGSFYDGFKWSDNVIFLGSDNVQKVEIPELNACVYGLSYHQTHGGDEKHIPINKKRVAMSGFDYVAMGHIHKPFMDEKYKMAYCGSLEPIDVNDTGERGYIYGEVDKKGLEFEFVPFSKRQYVDLDFTVTPNATNMEIRHRLSDIFNERGKDNMYRVTFNGYRDPEFEISIKDVMDCGNIVTVIDETIPDFDFEEMYADNKDNILGRFIGQYLDKEPLNPLQQKALYYGTKGLSQAMEGKV